MILKLLHLVYINVLNGSVIVNVFIVPSHKEKLLVNLLTQKSKLVLEHQFFWPVLLATNGFHRPLCSLLPV